MSCCDKSPDPPKCETAPTGKCCPTQFCHDSLTGLPEKQRHRLLGVEHGKKCMSVFPRGETGFVVSDEMGQHITKQPKFEGPHLVRYLYDNTGRPILKVGGGYQEDTPPGASAMIVADECGNAWRWRGPTGSRSLVAWDGCNMIMEPHPNFKELGDFPSVNGGESCGYREAVLVDLGGGTFTVGYRAVPSRLPGEIITWMGFESTIPEQWLMCDGSLYSPELYPDLFANIGYSHGRLDDDFRVPDLRGMFIRGVDFGSGNDPNAVSRAQGAPGGNSGDDVGTVQQDALQGHGHALSGFDFGEAGGSDTGVIADSAVTGNDQISIGGPNEAGSGPARVASETRPKNVSAIYLIYSGCRVD